MQWECQGGGYEHKIREEDPSGGLDNWTRCHVGSYQYPYSSQAFYIGFSECAGGIFAMGPWWLTSRCSSFHELHTQSVELCSSIVPIVFEKVPSYLLIFFLCV